MAKVVQFSRFGDPDVLDVVETSTPEPGPDEVLVEVVAAGLNPGESSIRRGERSGENVIFPVRQGRDLAGTVVKLGAHVLDFAVGDAVLGFVESGSHASHVLVPSSQLIPKPRGLDWEVAGGLYFAGTTAWKAIEDAAVTENDTVIITAAAGGVGCLAAQLAIARGARVIGTSALARFDFLRQLGVEPIAYDDDLVGKARRLAPDGIAVMLDFHGMGEAGVAVTLGISPHRIFTVLDLAAVEDYGVARATPGDIRLLARVAQLIVRKQIRLPIADIFSLERVADAYRALDRREAPGKIVLGMHPVEYRSQRVKSVEFKEQDATLGVTSSHQRLNVRENLPPVIGGHHPERPETHS